jgi:class 3 adenylate cyclase
LPYNVWGDKVNTASRMESSDIPGKINIPRSSYELVKSFFKCNYRDKLQAKGKGKMNICYVLGKRKERSQFHDGKTANSEFWDL